MTPFRITYAACVSPLGNQPVQNILQLNPIMHVDCGDYAYTDSATTFTINGVTLLPMIFWDFVATPNGAPPNALTAQYVFDKYHYHFGSAGLRNYREFHAACVARGIKRIKRQDDHDGGHNNQDNGLARFKLGYPFSTNQALGQIVDDANFTGAQMAQAWKLGRAGLKLIEAAYSDNPPRGAPNGDVAAGMVGFLSPSEIESDYYYQDISSSGVIGGSPCVRLLFPDSINYKSPQADTDNASKKFWGTAQKQWILDSAQDAVNKGAGMVVVCSTKDLFNTDNTDGPAFYSTDRDDLLQKIHDQNLPVIWMGGDKHVPHAGVARVANGQSYDCLSVCACPFGQGTGGLKQYKESIWWTGRNDACVLGLIEVDPAARTVTLSILDAWSLNTMFSAVVPFGQRLPSKVTTNVQQNFQPAISAAKVTPTIATNASPYVWQNTSDRPQSIVVAGANVTALAYSSDGSAYDPLTQIAGQFIVQPGHYLKTTFSANTPPTTFNVYPYSFVQAK